MKLTSRQAKLINEMIQDEVRDVVAGRRESAFRTARAGYLEEGLIVDGAVDSERVARKSAKRLREAIAGKQLGAPEPFSVSEELDATPQFESAHHELFHRALQPVVDQFTHSIMEIYEAGSLPESKHRAEKQLRAAAEEMREELLRVVERWTEVGADRII